MKATVMELSGTQCVVLDADGPVVDLRDGGRALVEMAMNEAARVIAVPAGRLDAEFFRLRSGVAGEALQKFVNYGFKFAVVGDVSEHVAASEALRDFVVECNRGRDVFFVKDAGELGEKLSALRAGAG